MTIVTLSYKGSSEDLISALQKDPYQQDYETRIKLDWLGDRAHFRLFTDSLGEKKFFINCEDKIQVIIVYDRKLDKFFTETTKKNKDYIDFKNKMKWVFK